MRSRAIAVLIVTIGVPILLGVAPGNAKAQGTYTPPGTSPPPVPAPITPDTSGCPNRVSPPPPVDLSEVPVPGGRIPQPLPLPSRPVGGERMGECGLVLPEGAPALPDGISATSWLLADAATGAVLAAKDPHARHRPASTIKLLTALLMADRLPPDQVVVATQGDADQEGSRVGVGPGGSYTVRQLLAGLLLVSGNDAAHALAGQLGGVPATIAALNDLAAGIGAHDTRAATPSGLDGPGMSSSAYDLALVFGRVLRNPLLAELLSTAVVDFPGFGDRPGFMISNDNRLLANYPGALGGKTGFTDDARHTYVGAAARGGRPLMVVLLRGEQRPVPMWEQAARLLDYGFALPPGPAVGRLVTGPQLAETQPTPSRTSQQSQPSESSSYQSSSSQPDQSATIPLPRSGGGDTASLNGSDAPGGIVLWPLWLAMAISALAVLGAVVMRKRS